MSQMREIPVYSLEEADGGFSRTLRRLTSDHFNFQTARRWERGEGWIEGDYLPSVRRPGGRHIGTFDIETGVLDGRQKAFAFGVVYVRGKYSVFRDPGEMVRFMVQRAFKGYTFYAHNANFDLTGLFGQYYDVGQVISNGTRVIKLSVPIPGSNRNYVNFSDSMVYFNFPLKKLGEIVGLEKLDIDFNNPDDVKEVLSASPRAVDYCKRDCEIVYKGLRLYEEVVNSLGAVPGLTNASTALRVWRAGLKDRVIINSEADDKFFDAYYGGRTEVFKKQLRDGYYYDVNSLYPSVMSKYPYPDPSQLYIVKNIPLEAVLWDYEGMADVTVFVPKELKIGVLPVKMNTKKVQGNIYPTGTLSGKWCFPELRAAISVGCEILETREVVYGKGVNLFTDYVNRLYSLRREYQKQGNPAENIVKIMLNSLYGKFAQHKKPFFGKIEEIREGFDFNPITPDGVYGFWSKEGETGSPSPHAIHCFASYVTSYARVELLKGIFSIGIDNIVYVDTDSMFTLKPLPDNLVGAGLGQWKDELKGGTTDGVFLRRKLYLYWDSSKNPGQWKLKAKGVPANILTFEDYFKTEIVAEVNHLITPRQSIRGQGEAGTPVRRPKTLNLSDDKRVWVGGESRPFHVENGVLA